MSNLDTIQKIPQAQQNSKVCICGWYAGLVSDMLSSLWRWMCFSKQTVLSFLFIFLFYGSICHYKNNTLWNFVRTKRWFFTFILKIMCLFGFVRRFVKTQFLNLPQNFNRLSWFEKHVSVPGCTKQRWGGHCTLNPVYHRGRPAHWHWTLSHLKEGRGTAQRLSPDTRQNCPKQSHRMNLF